MTDRESGRSIDCRVIFVFSTADQKVAAKARKKSVEKIRDGLMKIQRSVAEGRRNTDATSIARRVSKLFGKRQQSYSELVNHELKTPLAVHPVFLKSPHRVEALVFLLMATLTLYFLIQRIYRQNVSDDASTKERRTTTQTILRAFNRYTLIIHHTRLGREVQPTRLTTRQRQVLQQLGFDTPAQILSRRLSRAP